VSLFLKGQEKTVDMVIYDIYGKQVYAKKFNNVFYIDESCDLQHLPSGMYNVLLRTSNAVYSRKLVLAH
jgi:hypothetical protein